MDDKELVRLIQDSSLVISKLQHYVESLQTQNAVLSVQNETWQRVSESDDKVEMSAVAKLLDYDGIGRNKLFKILRDEKILRYNNEPYQEYIDRGYFSVIEQEVSVNYDNTIINKKTIVTQKGIDYIRKKLDKLGY